MRNWLQNTFALSEQGAKDMLRGIVLSAAANLTLMLPVGMMVLALGALLQPVLGGDFASPNALFYLVASLAILAIVFLIHYFQYTSVYVSTYQESAARRVSLAETLRQLPLSFFGQRNLADLTNTIMGDCANLEHASSHALPQLFGAAISTTVVAIALLVMDWRLGLALLWVVPFSLAVIFASKKAQDKAGLKHILSKRVCADGIQECLETVQEIRACNHKEDYLAGLNQKLEDAEKSQVKSELITAALVTAGQTILQLGLATVVLMGAALLVQGQVTLLTYLIFLIAASQIYNPLSAALSYIAEVFHTGLQIERMRAIENQPMQQGVPEYTPQGYDIVFEQVSFSYHTGEPILQKVSFTAKQGQVTALVGPSGGGKSTTAKLAARFWDITGGRITLGGVDISTVEPEALLKSYSIVFQDVVLFNDTVMENIRLGRRTATDAEVLEAARAAQCEGFIHRLPNGYQTVIGENGSTLSGGERQRLSIARALLKDAPVILLDEATASLDVENESEIQKAISRLVQGKTVLVVAHRMRTVAGADQLIVLENGQLTQQGSPAELLEQPGTYRRMVELQTQTAEWSL